MLDYTKMAIRQTISDLKKADYVRNVATQIIYIVYLVYTLIARTGYLAVNIILLALALSYFVFFLTITSVGKTPEGKTIKKITTRVYVWCKRLIKLFTLGLTVYGICTAVEHVSPVSVVLAALMIVGWILQILFEVIIKIVTNRIAFILEGLEADLDNMMKPVRSVGNFFKKVTGREVSPAKEPTKNQLKLKEKVEAYRAEQKQKRADEKQRRETERTAAKEEKRNKRASVRAENKLLKEADKRKAQEEKLSPAKAEAAFSVSDPSDGPTSPPVPEKRSLFSKIKDKFIGDQPPTPSFPADKEVFEEDTEWNEADEKLLKAYINSTEAEEERDEENAPESADAETEAETAPSDKPQGFFRSLFRKK